MITKKLPMLVALAAFFMLLAACDSQPASPTSVGPGTVTVTATAQPDVTLPPGTLLAYGMTGGIAGFNTALVLQESGDYVLTSRNGEPTTGKLDQARLDKIKLQLDAVRSIPDLQVAYDNGNVADDIYRSVTLDRNGTPMLVLVAEQGGKDITPAPLQQLIATLKDVAEAP